MPWVAVLSFMMAAGIAARVLVTDRLLYEIWADRDLSRAEELFRRPSFTGAEFDRGGRTPGGFYYLLLRAYLMLGKDPARAQLGAVALDVIALLALADAARRHVGWPAGLAVGGFYAAAPAVLDQLRIAAYNPTNAIPFGVLAHVFFLEALVARRAWALSAALGLVALAAQIHFSYALLVPLFILVLVVQRVRLGARAWAAAAVVFVLAYAPYLVADGRAGWPNLREIGKRQGVLATPAILALLHRNAAPEAHPRLDSLADVLLAFPPAVVATPWRRLGPVLLYRVPAWRLFPIMMLAGFLVLLLRAWWRPGLSPSSSATRRVATAALTIIGAGLALLSLRNTSLVVRYVLFLVPSATLLLGCAFQAYAEALVAAPRWWSKTLLNVVLLYWAALFANAGTLWWYAVGQRPVLTTARWQRLIADLQGEMALGPEDLVTRVAVFDGSRERWALLSPTEAAGAYLVRAFARPRPGDPRGRCAAVLVPSAAGEPVGAAEVSEALSLLPTTPAPVDVRLAAPSGDAVIVSYRLPGGGCYHNLGDRYVLLPEEELIAAQGLGAGPSSGAAREIPAAPGRRFVVTLTSARPERWPLRALVEVTVQDGLVSATLHSNELRGYDGISSLRARGTALVLRGGSRAWRVPIYEGTLGGWFTAAQTPWRGAPVAVPAGTYAVDLSVDEVAFLESEGWEGPRPVALTPALEVVRPGPPRADATGPAPPPAGRASPGTPGR